MLYEFQYVAPKTKSELLALLDRHGDSCKIMAGGTDLLVDIRAGLRKPQVLIDIKKVSDFKPLSFSEKEGLLIGPATTCADVIRDKTVSREFPILIQAAKQLASTQVRNRATIVGNICNASPCADTALPLLCLDASVHIVSKSGSRIVKLKDFFTGVKKTALRKDEVVEKITVPSSMAGGRGGFMKLKRIKGHDLSLVSVCLVKKGSLLRVAIGSASPTPVVLKDFPAQVTADNVADEALRSVKPIDDIRCSKDYRLFMIKTYIERLIEEC
ncbi:MAG TPA: xanthine dehydrogenase family protein subunit M [Elusimicrobiota bacterium]|nr:xanthine dehydrogenase family protein subunit M [Elusimicrobiota bacterium]